MEKFESIYAMIGRGGKMLKRWKQVIEQEYPTYKHDIPDDMEMNIGKLSGGGQLILIHAMQQERLAM